MLQQSAPVQCLAPVGDSGSNINFVGTFSIDVPRGAAVLVHMVASGSVWVTPTDSAGNTYVLDRMNSMASGIGALYRCVVTNQIVGGVTTLTSKTTAGSFKAMAAYTFPNFQTFQADKGSTNSGQSTATPGSGTSGVLLRPNELVIVAFAWSLARTFTEPTNYTNMSGSTGTKASTSGTVVETAMAYRYVAPTTTISVTCTLSSTTTDCGLIQTYTYDTPEGQLQPTVRPFPFAPGGM